MYQNLRAEMARKNFTMSLLSKETGIGYQGLSYKMNGKRDFTLEETLAIKNALGVDLPLEVLFANEE